MRHALALVLDCTPKINVSRSHALLPLRQWFIASSKKHAGGCFLLIDLPIHEPAPYIYIQVFLRDSTYVPVVSSWSAAGLLSLWLILNSNQMKLSYRNWLSQLLYIQLQHGKLSLCLSVHWCCNNMLHGCPYSSTMREGPGVVMQLQSFSIA